MHALQASSHAKQNRVRATAIRKPSSFLSAKARATTKTSQGLPFVGRAGKLLDQMIEAMGLQRKDVYICNVVKCRPPENRLPERDEIEPALRFCCASSTSSHRKVIVCLGACAAQTLLQTNRGISHFPRPVAGISRPPVDGHLSSRVFAAQSRREERSLERSAKSNGRARPRSERAASPPSAQQALVIRMGVLLGLLTALAWGSSDFLARFAARRIGSLRTTLYMQLTGLVLLTICLPWVGGWGHLFDGSGWQPWAWGALAGIFNGVASLALYRSFEVGKMAVVAPLSASYPGAHGCPLVFLRRTPDGAARRGNRARSWRA